MEWNEVEWNVFTSSTTRSMLTLFALAQLRFAAVWLVYLVGLVKAVSLWLPLVSTGSSGWGLHSFTAFSHSPPYIYGVFKAYYTKIEKSCQGKNAYHEEKNRKLCR